MLRRAIRSYDRALNARPLRTKIMTSLSMISAGDVLRQTAFERRREWDGARTARMATFGLTVHPIWAHFWFGYLERWLGTAAAGASGAAVLRLGLQKMVCDQLLSAPLFLGIFAAQQMALRGGGLDDVRRNLRETWLETIKSGWSFWSVAHTINFCFVPLHWRILYMNVASVAIYSWFSGIQAATAGAQRSPLDALYRLLGGAGSGLGRWAEPYFLGAMGAGWLGFVASGLRCRRRVGTGSLIGWSCIGLAGVAALAGALREEEADRTDEADESACAAG
jgi:hypothetical protein